MRFTYNRYFNNLRQRTICHTPALTYYWLSGSRWPHNQELVPATDLVISAGLGWIHPQHSGLIFHWCVPFQCAYRSPPEIHSHQWWRGIQYIIHWKSCRAGGEMLGHCPTHSGSRSHLPVYQQDHASLVVTHHQKKIVKVSDVSFFELDFFFLFHNHAICSRDTGSLTKYSDTGVEIKNL